jgi:hypothetical protein
MDGGVLQQPGHNPPLDSGLPHLLQTGGTIRGKSRKHFSQIKSPHLPQPRHLDGKKKSTNHFGICVKDKNKYQS